jgi:hypothetical protein
MLRLGGAMMRPKKEDFPMRLPAIFLAIVTVSAFAAACGGGSNSPQLLHLHGYDITPDNYRTNLRALLLQPGASSFCNGIKGLSLQAVVDTLKASAAGDTSSPSPPANSTPIPAQTVNAADAITASQIIIDECSRVSG